MRSSIAHHNVTGIEIENSERADVYKNKTYNNTGGILVFDLPNLVKKKGGHVRVFDNQVYENNPKNFASKGNIVAGVPQGTSECMRNNMLKYKVAYSLCVFVLVLISALNPVNEKVKLAKGGVEDGSMIFCPITLRNLFCGIA